MHCELCTIIHEEFRLVSETTHSFSIVCGQPIKEGHIMVLPKRHVTQNTFSELTPEESHDFLSLLENMQIRLSEVYVEDIMIFKNSDSHSSQSHFHMHLVPSKGNMRKLVGSYEDIPTHPDVPNETYIRIRKNIISK